MVEMRIEEDKGKGIVKKDKEERNGRDRNRGIKKGKRNKRWKTIGMYSTT